MPTTKHLGRMPYIPRDESWMYFNKRLLTQAMRPDVPLLERFNYLGIYSNNLDEFFRVRIASLLRTIEYRGIPEPERKIARSTLFTVARLNKEYSQLFEKTLSELIGLLDREHIHIINERELTPEQEKQVLEYYTKHLSGAINPIYPDSPSFSPEQHLKETLYLAVVLTPRQVSDRPHKQTELALLEIPAREFGRFVRLPDIDGESYLLFLDDVIRFSLPYIFVGMEYESYEAFTFKFTKDAEIEVESDLRSSMLDRVSQGLKQRKRGEPIRLVYDASMPEVILRKLSDIADLSSHDTRIGGGRYHNMRDLMSLPHCGRTDLRFPAQFPLQSQRLHYSESMIQLILERDRGVHFPYQSFDHFLRLLSEAAISRDVTEIRISLYRVAQNSKVIKALMAAAQNGKRVIAVVELLARFDEQSNINWSKKMQDSGVQVVIGHEKLKIHSKMVHISLRNNAIACIGSGNLHEGTARLYTDYMLMTAHKGITSDVLKVFDFIERPFIPVRFRELLVAPNEMRRRLYYKINREIKNAQEGKEAYIKMKINHIVDERMVQKLYEASQAGVQVQLCIRGNCSLVPGIPGYSENIYANGIIDRYLEHSRIYIFANGGHPQYFIGSTDWMPRNLDKRIEVMTPVYDEAIQQELAYIVQAGLNDTAQGYFVNEHDGKMRRDLLPEGTPLFRSQEILYETYKHNKFTY